jgi:hypothetical protein
MTSRGWYETLTITKIVGARKFHEFFDGEKSRFRKWQRHSADPRYDTIKTGE